VSATEPTIADVLAEIQLMRREQRAELAELRAELAEHRLRTSGQLDDIRRRLGTLVDDLTDFHREYNQHGHPHTHGADGEIEAA